MNNIINKPENVVQNKKPDESNLSGTGSSAASSTGTGSAGTGTASGSSSGTDSKAAGVSSASSSSGTNSTSATSTGGTDSKTPAQSTAVKSDKKSESKKPAGSVDVTKGNPNLLEALAKIKKGYGEGSVMRMGDKPQEHIESIKTGSIALDTALGIGGLPKGRIVEIYGPESSGKTTLTLHAVAEVQKAGGIAAFIDAEHAIDPEYAAAIGVDVENLLISQPDTGEQALEIADMLIHSGEVDLIVIDSVAALVPEAEIKGDMGASHMGLQARLMSQALRKITGTLSSTGTTAIFINQLRDKIGVVFGNPETTTGGKALKFYSSVRLDIRRGEAIKENDTIVGNKTKVKVVKNKMAPPFKVAEFDIIYGEGISYESSLIDQGVAAGVLIKSGGWYAYNGEQLGQGKDKIRALLKDDLKLATEIEEKIRAGFDQAV
ncbi:MAG: recombinase RecA [Bifidobacteriaceae bacterium]|jgi:recombination protein RecA|nr:recombinase RecA [Bifidobacteriaceae bacterium]